MSSNISFDLQMSNGVAEEALLRDDESPIEMDSTTSTNETFSLCSGISSPEQLLVKSLGGKIIIFGLYALIFVLGTMGNVAVMVAVWRNKSMRTPTNIFIVNLAVSDVLMCLFAIPFTPLHYFMNEWVLGVAACKLFPTGQGISVYMSTLTLTCIAFDRYMAVVHPYRARSTSTSATKFSIGVNVLAAIFTAPYFWYMTVIGGYYLPLEENNISVEYETNNLTSISSNVNHFNRFEYVPLRCTESWPGTARKYYGTFTNITQFVLPFTTIFLCYSLIVVQLSRQQNHRPGAAPQSIAREVANRERKRKTNRLCIAMVIIFGASWLPLNLINLMADISDLSMFCWPYHHFTHFIFHIVAMSSNCYNPFLYGYLNDAFRQEFSKMFPCLFSAAVIPNSNLEATQMTDTFRCSKNVNIHLSEKKHSQLEAERSLAKSLLQESGTIVKDTKDTVVDDDDTVLNDSIKCGNRKIDEELELVESCNCDHSSS